MSVTIYDVARKAGVGIATVSRAFNDSSLIREETKEKILKIADEMHYQPHGVARGLARQQTHTIATVVPFFFNYLFLNLLKTVQYTLLKNQYDLFLYSIEKWENQAHIFDRVLNERKSDGVMLFSMTIDDKYAERFINSNIPVIIVDNYHPLLDSISISNKKGAREAVQHLISLGHEKIAIINGSLSSYPARIRLEGYKEALTESNLHIDPRYMINANPGMSEDGFNEIVGYRALKQLASLGKERPTAVFIASDIQALGALRAAKEEQLNVPNDMAMIGFDDIDFAQYVGLSTMRQPVHTMAELAVNRLLRIIEKKNRDKFQVELSAELIVRDTCGGKKTEKTDIRDANPSNAIFL